MKKSEIFKRFIFVPITCFVMLVLMWGYVVLAAVGFLQRPATIAPEFGVDAADNETEALKVGKAPEKVKNGDARIDINKATVEELMRLPGIGPARARAIVAQRIKMQGFYSVDDLACTDGIGTKTLEALRELITASEYKGEK